MACLESLRRVNRANVDVVCVDNGSTDGSVEAVRAAHPETHLLENGRNLGFSGGNNVGVEYALDRGANWIVLLNNDATIARDAIDAFVDAAGRHPGAGVLAGKILFQQPADRVWFAGQRFNSLLGYSGRPRGYGKQDGPRFSRTEPTDRAAGALMAVSRSAITAAGMLDDQLFAYIEDVDWCLKIKAAGFHVLFTPSAALGTRSEGRPEGSTDPPTPSTTGFATPSWSVSGIGPGASGDQPASYRDSDQLPGSGASPEAMVALVWRRVGRLPRRAERSSRDTNLRILKSAHSLARDRALTAADTWERHLVVAELSGRPQQVVDVGGLPGQLAAFLPDTCVLAANVTPPADLLVDAGELPFRDRAVDVVTSLDALEHVVPAARADFVAELLRVTRRRLVLCCPLGTPHHREAELQIQQWHRSVTGEMNPWLAEHLENGLPTQRDLETWFSKVTGPGDRWYLRYHGDFRRTNEQFMQIVKARHRPTPAALWRFGSRRLSHRPDRKLTQAASPYTNRVFGVVDRTRR